MINTTTLPASENLAPALVVQNAGVEHHAMAGTHLAAASKHHLDAAMHHKAGDHDKADQSIIAAQAQLHLAGKSQIEELKYHALKS